MRLKQWSIDRIKRRQSRRQHDPRGHDPLVLVRMVASRQLVTALCGAARSHGITPGMTLAEARALCPKLAHRAYRPDQDMRSLEGFARWMNRFSPAVAMEPPDAILLDVTGSERLFGSLERLNCLVSDALWQSGITHGIATAPTPGAAWALASFGRDHSEVINLDQLQAALTPLPTSALRLEEDVVEAFHGLGIETIGQLMELPRGTLPARFGTAVLDRLDQALDRVAEPLVIIKAIEPIQAQLDFRPTESSY